MKYTIDIIHTTEGDTKYWVLCGAYAVAEFSTLSAAENWIQNNPDWDCDNCYNCLLYTSDAADE